MGDYAWNRIAMGIELYNDRQAAVHIKVKDMVPPNTELGESENEPW